MDDADERAEPGNDKSNDKGDEKSSYTALAIVFAGVGLVFMITMDTPALALPFIALGIAFFAMGISAVTKKKTADDTNDDAPGP